MDPEMAQTLQLLMKILEAQQLQMKVYGQYWSAWFPYLAGFSGFFLLLLTSFACLIWRQLKAIHSGDFVAAWTAIVEKMEDPHRRRGRGFLRFLQTETEAGDRQAIPRDEWPRMFEVWPHRATSDQWYSEDLNFTQTVQAAKDAYDQFDLAGILVLRSRIPNLLEVFVAEYQDSIIACWEQGSCFFKDRVLEMLREGRGSVREELYHCFSVLYVLAKHRREVAPKLYPYYTWIDRWRLRQSGSALAHEARRERDKLIQGSLDEASRRDGEE